MSFDDENPYRAPESTHAPSPIVESESNLADRGTRFVAKLLDGFIGMAITMPLMLLTGYWGRAMEQQAGAMEMILFTLGGFVVYYLIHGYLLANKGQTVGKMLMGIRIEDYNTGQLIPMGRMVGLRDLPVMLLSVVPILNLLGIVDTLFIFRKDRRCVHDLIGKTKVVKVAK